MLKCMICGKFYHTITISHLRKHCITVEEYKDRYGNKVVSDGVRQRMTKLNLTQINLSDLGNKPDSVISLETGFSRRTICHIRNNLNILPYTGVVLTKEGLPCRSIYEGMYDAYLHEKGITHLHNQRVGPYIADFKLDKIYVEIAGMVGYARYDDKLKEKKKYYKDNKIRCTWLYRDDVELLFIECKSKVDFRDRFCSACNKNTHDLVNGMCRPCNRKNWGKLNGVENLCEFCGNEYIVKAGSTNAKFCSRDCYWNSMRSDIPSEEDLIRMLKTCRVSDIARTYNVSSNVISQRIYRYKMRRM